MTLNNIQTTNFDFGVELPETTVKLNFAYLKDLELFQISVNLLCDLKLWRFINNNFDRIWTVSNSSKNVKNYHDKIHRPFEVNE